MSEKRKVPVIGITGGAGSGKSHIAGLLQTVCNVYHINTDRVSEMQMRKGGCVYDAVVDYFGPSFLLEDGEVNRKKLGEYVFDEPEELHVLNSITHPAVRIEVERQIQAAQTQAYDAVLLETALLIEAGYENICDDIWYVYATQKLRRHRLMVTRGYTAERVRDMFRRQNTERFFRMHADFVINNNARTEESLKRSLKYRIKKLQRQMK